MAGKKKDTRERSGPVLWCDACPITFCSAACPAAKLCAKGARVNRRSLDVHTVLDDGGELASQLELDQKVVGGVAVEEGDDVLLADSIREELLVGPVLCGGRHYEGNEEKERRVEWE